MLGDYLIKSLQKKLNNYLQFVNNNNQFQMLGYKFKTNVLRKQYDIISNNMYATIRVNGNLFYINNSLCLENYKPVIEFT